MTNINKIVVLAGITALITNPLTGQYILQFLDWGFQQIFIRGAYVNLVASVIVMVYILLVTFKRSPEKLPSKNQKTKVSSKEYIAT